MPKTFALRLSVCCLALLALGVAASAEEHVINIVGLDFVPDDLTINVGDTVRWINDGNAAHNVVADDGSFNSGPPSPDTWEFTHTFNKGGTWTYHCEPHQAVGMVGSITVVGVFGDSFDGADLQSWDQEEPDRPYCVCYFSADCGAGTFCDYGPGGFSTHDICTWVDVKPNGNPGTGCNEPHIGPWGGEICDGICSPDTAGSSLGSEALELLTQGMLMWAEAILQPSEAGGGPVDPVLAAQIDRLGFDQEFAATILGRQTADLMVLAGGQPFYKHFCHHEQYPEDPDPALYVDLSADPEGAAMMRLLVEAVTSEMGHPGTAGDILARLPATCPDYASRVSVRCAGDNVLKCL
ncbi:MAG: plastocyanin/azurin family copper-binding protein, partial [Acidobacteriota bacterium]